MKCYKSFDMLEPSLQEMEETASQGRLLTMEIEFSRKCNFECIYCYLANGGCQSDKELAKEEFFDVILQAKDLGARTIIILGGEPMLYPHIWDMIKFIREQSLNIKLFTNGFNINSSAAKKLFDYGVNVVLKMNTFDKKIQDMLSGKKGANQQIQDAFNSLIDAGYPGKNAHFGVCTIICQYNIGELVDMWEWLKNKNIIPYFEMVTPQGRAKKNNSIGIDSQQAKELFYRIQEIDREKFNSNWAPQPPLVGGECLRHLYSCVVNANGDVQPCVGVTIAVGNVREKKLSDIIKNSEVIQELRNYKKNIKGPCRQCDKLKKCYGCRGTAYQLTGDYLASDPSCWNNAEKLDDIVYLPTDVSNLLPHKRPMRIVDRLLSIEEKRTVTEVDVSKDKIFVSEEGKLDETAYLEIIAQSLAAMKGFKNLSNGKSLEGFLLGAKRMKIYDSAVVGDKLTSSIYKVGEYENITIVRGEIFKDKKLIAEGEIKTWHKV